MRPDAGLIQVLRNPLAQSLQAAAGPARAESAKTAAAWQTWGARAEAPERAQGTGGVYLATGVLAAGGLAGMVLLASGIGRARGARHAGAAGGGRRLSHLRAAVRLPAPQRAGCRGRAGQDGRRRPRQRPADRRCEGRGPLSQSRPAAPDGPALRAAMPRSRSCWRASPSSAQAFFRLNRAAERVGVARRGAVRTHRRAWRAERALAAGIGAPASGPARRCRVAG